MSAFLKQFKTSRYFPTKVISRTFRFDHEVTPAIADHSIATIPRAQVRSTISDFAVFLTIAFMVLLDYAIGVPSQKLKVPSKFQVRGNNDIQYLYIFKITQGSCETVASLLFRGLHLANQR